MADLMAVDLVGSDGVADTWIDARSAGSYTPPGLSADQMREANDRMVQQIVTMQQLRQFNPSDTNWYVPNGQTPSLLLPGTSPEAAAVPSALCDPARTSFRTSGIPSQTPDNRTGSRAAAPGRPTSNPR